MIKKQKLHLEQTSDYQDQNLCQNFQNNLGTTQKIVSNPPINQSRN
jgi:hypothetical protein